MRRFPAALTLRGAVLVALLEDLHAICGDRPLLVDRLGCDAIEHLGITPAVRTAVQNAVV